MIASEFDPTAGAGRIVLRPNRSWSWGANTRLAASLVAASGAVGVWFAWHGLWGILPFALLEGVALLAGLYCCVRRTHVQEVLTFSSDYLMYERGIGRPSTCRRFRRYFARFFVCPASHPWYRRRIALRCRGQEVEIGSFLTGEEQEDLIRALRDMIQRLDSPVR